MSLSRKYYFMNCLNLSYLNELRILYFFQMQQEALRPASSSFLNGSYYFYNWLASPLYPQ